MVVFSLKKQIEQWACGERAKMRLCAQGKNRANHATVSGAKEKKATAVGSDLFAPHQGLEPWTYGLTVRRSNRLS